jgi:aldose sugar dehydrogenase
MKKNWLTRCLGAGLLFASSAALSGVMDQEDLQDEFDAGYKLEIERLAAPFEFPSSVSLLPDGKALVTERVGRLWLVGLAAVPLEIDGVPPVLNRDHAGLLDVALDAGFRRNGILYFSYSSGDEVSSTIRIMRARLDLPELRLRDQEVIFESTPATSFEHLGGRMVITDDGYLFLSLGDRQDRERAQNLTDHAGSIIRIHTDGSIPSENPFTSVEGARPEIWSYGHRNPQGLALDVRTGRLWAHEHGAKGGDELNLIVAGANYGWPRITYGVEYNGDAIGDGVAQDGMQQPMFYWSPDIAPSGLAVESAEGLTTFWLGTLVGQSLVKLDMREEHIQREVRLLHNFLGRIRDVRIGKEGYLYLVTDNPKGGLFRVHVVQTNRLSWP